MGSFNQTCAITNCPILPGQEAIVFFLALDVGLSNIKERKTNLKNFPYMGSYSYPYNQFKIIGHPLSAIYNDTDKFKYNDAELVDFTLKTINSVYIPNETETDSENSIIDTILELETMVSKGILRIKTPFKTNTDHNGTSFISKMVILKSVFENIVKKQNNIEYSMFFDTEQINSYFPDDFYIDDYNPKPFDMHVSLYEKFLNFKPNDPKNIKMFDLLMEKSLNSSLKSVFISNYYHNFKNANDKKSVAKSIASLYFIEKWFNMFSFEFKPMLTSPDFINYPRFEKNYEKITSEIFDHLSACQSLINDESISLKKIVSFSYEMEIKELKSKQLNWYHSTELEFIEFSLIIDFLEKEKPQNFSIGDLSSFDLFSKKYSLFSNIENGTVICFRYD